MLSAAAVLSSGPQGRSGADSKADSVQQARTRMSGQRSVKGSSAGMPSSMPDAKLKNINIPFHRASSAPGFSWDKAVAGSPQADGFNDHFGNRPSHKQVEQHRRLKAKEYFEELRELLPESKDQRTDRNRILQSAIEYLKGESPSHVSTSLNEVGIIDEGEELQFGMEDLGDSSQSKLSHNEVEQRRRLLARKLFDDLRALLPNSGKFDKNTILYHTIQLIKNRQNGSVSSFAHGYSLEAGSPADVTQGATALQSSGRGKKRSPPESENGSGTECDIDLARSPQESELASSYEDGSFTELGDKKRRVLNKIKRETPSSELIPRSERGYSLEDETAAFEALTLLSDMAERISAPSTPICAPQPKTECSAMNLSFVLS